jgi:hypothetical protein
MATVHNEKWGVTGVHRRKYVDVRDNNVKRGKREFHLLTNFSDQGVKLISSTQGNNENLGRSDQGRQR